MFVLRWRSKAQVQHGCRRGCWDCRRSAWPSYASLSNRKRKRHARAYRNAHVDQNRVPNNLLVNEPSLSTQGIGGNCGRYDAYGSTFASLTLPGNRARKTLFIPPSSPLYIGEAGTLSLSNCANLTSSVRCFSNARRAIFEVGHVEVRLNTKGNCQFRGGWGRLLCLGL